MSSLKWWENAVIYQIYPRSFQDSNDDGIGDLKGITSRLNYLSELGVDAIWISPFFKSPQKDFGYDVSDYYNINPEYGTLEDFELLISKAHNLTLKVMLDIVPAHCSSEHPWFVESRSSTTNPKSDWFHWAEPKEDGSAPTNWLSFFGGQAWTWEPRRQQYYLHNFLPEQPNLNYANPEVLEEFNQIAKFWFDRGVDGFRLDAVHTINADSFPYKDNPANPKFKLGPLPQDQQPFFRQLHDAAQLNQPAIQDFCASYREIADSYENDRFLMGEVDGDNDSAIIVSETFTKPGRLHATYNFDLLEWGGLTVKEIKEAILRSAKVFNNTGRLSFAFSNHDVPRVATRQLKALNVSPKDSDKMQILLLKLQISLIGSTCIYQGEELGLEDVSDIPKEKMQDPWGIEFAPTFLGRDTCRTPMVWNKNLPNGGFSKANTTWLPISDKHLERAAIDSALDPNSIYNDLAKFLKWRKKQSAMTEANCILNIAGDDTEISFDRESDDQTLHCNFNFKTLTASFEEI